MKLQYRFYTPEDNELRALDEEEQMIIEGYAAKYNVRSELLSENGIRFIEILETGTFRDHLQDETYFSFNHSFDKVMAHTRNATLILSEDDVGLKFRAILNNTTDSKDLYERVKRGDIDAMSFGFKEDVKKQKLDRSSNSVPIMRISGIRNLFDISAVTRAAYPNTELYVRSLNDMEVDEPEKLYDSTPYIRKLKLIKLKNNLK